MKVSAGSAHDHHRAGRMAHDPLSDAAHDRAPNATTAGGADQEQLRIQLPGLLHDFVHGVAVHKMHLRLLARAELLPDQRVQFCPGGIRLRLLHRSRVVFPIYMKAWRHVHHMQVRALSARQLPPSP